MNLDNESLPGLSQPSRVRYRVLLFLGSMTFILYLDRVCIGQAAKAIQEDLGLSNTAMGFVFGAFTLAYALFEVPAGNWGDRHGARGVLTRIVVCWSVFTALTGAAVSLWMLLAVRFLFGAGEAGALPNTARVLSRWFPPSARGMAQGIVTTSMLIGGAVSPVVASQLIPLVGWRWSFVVFGCVGLLWAAAFYFWFRDDPAQHPNVNNAELRFIMAETAKPSAVKDDWHIAAGKPPVADARGSSESSLEHPPIPWALVLGSANVWLMGGLMNCAAGVFYMLISWYPKYLQDGRQAPAELSGWLTGMVLAGGALGCIVGGKLTDGLQRLSGSARLSRCTLGSVAFVLAAVSLEIGLSCEDVVLSAAFTTLTFFFMQCQIPAWWATVTQISGKHVGAMFGLMNSMGVVGAIGSQLFLGSLVDWLLGQGYSGRDPWDLGIYAYALVMWLGLCLWFGVDPNKSAVEDEEQVARGRLTDPLP